VIQPSSAKALQHTIRERPNSIEILRCSSQISGNDASMASSTLFPIAGVLKPSTGARSRYRAPSLFNLFVRAAVLLEFQLTYWVGSAGGRDCKIIALFVGKKYRPEQVVNLLRQTEVATVNGKSTDQTCRGGIVGQRYCRCRKEYGDLQVNQAKRSKDLEQENAKLERP
jgi:putative transposase